MSFFIFCTYFYFINFIYRRSKYICLAILVLYLRNKLEYSENDATTLYHIFTMSVNFMCLVGAIISDIWLGRFKTIFYLSIIYSIGSTVVSASSIPMLDLPSKPSLAVGLLFIAVGSGGIKTCVTAFGGDQFKLPEQKAEIATYFSLFYFTINLGSLLSDTITPVLRAYVHCFGHDDCFPLAFGVPAILMFIAIGKYSIYSGLEQIFGLMLFFLLISVLFLGGKSSYTRVKVPSKSMTVQVFMCMMVNVIL